MGVLKALLSGASRLQWLTCNECALPMCLDHSVNYGRLINTTIRATRTKAITIENRLHQRSLLLMALSFL